MNRRLPIVAIAASAIILSGGAALYLLTMGQDFAQCEGGQVAGGGNLIGGPFELTRHDGVRVTEKEVIDGLTLMYFGYTYCPDICPFDVARNADAVDILKARGHDVTPVMVTVDPERDTPEVLADFISYMHPDMIGLTGSPEDVEAIKTAYRVYGAKAGEETDDYLVDHSTLSYLMAPDYGMLAFFRRDMPAEQMADRISCFAEAL